MTEQEAIDQYVTACHAYRDAHQQHEQAHLDGGNMATIHRALADADLAREAARADLTDTMEQS